MATYYTQASILTSSNLSAYAYKDKVLTRAVVSASFAS